MSYKEIAVPSSKVKEVYEKILTDLEPLLGPWEERQQKVYAIYKEEYKKYREHHSENLVRHYFSSWTLAVLLSEVDHNPARDLKHRADNFLKAAKLSDEIIMTEAQVNVFHKDEITGVDEVHEELLKEFKYIPWTPPKESEILEDSGDTCTKVQVSEHQNSTKDTDTSGFAMGLVTLAVLIGLVCMVVL